MIEFVSGDFFDYEADIRVNTVNCVGVMGAGVALVFKNKFPDMFIDYYNACKKNEVKPGKPHVWEEINLIFRCTIVNFPTKVHWRDPSKYEYIEKGLIWLRQFLLDKENSTVTLPALGCGHGGLEWDKVKVMIAKYLGDLNTRILVFEPSSSTKTSNHTVSEEELKNQNVTKLLPSDKFYPSSLVGRSALEMYCKGNLNLLKSKSVAIISNPYSTDREKDALLRFISELPTNNFVFILGLNNSYETDLAKEILLRGFQVIFIIPYGILQLKVRNDLKPFWDYQRLAVISTTSPDQAWKKYESVNALRLRYKLANVSLINSLDYNHFLHYMDDIKQPNNRVFYINYWNGDLDYFQNLNAQKIGINPVTDRPNVLPLLSTLDKI